MSEYDIAIKIAGQLEGSFKNAIKGAQQGLSGLGISGKVGSLALKGVGVAAKATAAGLAAAGAGIAAVGAYSVNIGKEFEAQMSTVAAISGATGDDFDALQKKAKEMGATTSFSATEAGQAMEYMAMAGWKTKDMVDGIEGIMNLAAASGEELALTSDIVTDALTAFGLSAKDSGHFADVLAAASSNANTNVAMLGESFQYAAPVAGALGISAEDTSIALGLMANAGIKASSAGTALRTGLTNLAKPTKQMQEYMDLYNISMIENADGSINLRDTMVDLRSKMSELSESEQAAAAAAIFGKNSMAGWLAIVNSSEQDFEKLTAAIDNANGSAAEMAAIKLNNLEGDITLLKSAAEAFGISVYENMQSPLRGIAQYGKTQIGVLQEALDSGGFEGLTKAIGSVLADGVGKIAENAPAFIDGAADLVESLLNGIDGNADAIGGSIGRLITSLGNAVIRLAPRLATTGIHLLIAIANGIIDNRSVLKDAALETVEYLWTSVKEGFKSFADFLGDDEVEPFKKVLAMIPALVAGFALFDGIGGTVKSFAANIKGAGKSVPGAAKNIGKGSGEMAAAAKNFAAVGAGIALAAGGIWLLVDTAIRLTEAGPAAGTVMLLMAGTIAAFMLIASKMGPTLQESSTGLIAFGMAILMVSAGMSMMALAATQLGEAGPLALAGITIMVGGMAALMAIAGSMGTQLATAAPGLIAFGTAILIASAGMAVMAYTAIQLSQAGAGAIAMFAGIAVALAAFMAIASSLGPTLVIAGAGMLLLGTGLLIAAAAMALLANTAIALTNAGAPAIVMLAALMAAVLAFGAAAGALAPLLIAGGAALAVFGAGLAVVAAAALIASAAILVISAALPALSKYGKTAAEGILTVGTALTAFGVETTAAGVGAAAASGGFTAMALAAAAAAVAFAPLALEMGAVAASVAVIEASSKVASGGMNAMKNSASGMDERMKALVTTITPAAATIAAYALAASGGAKATGTLAVSLTATVVAMGGVAAAIVAATLAFKAFTAGTKKGVNEANTAVKTGMNQMKDIMVQGMTAAAQVATQKFAMMVVAISASGAQMTVIAVSAANGVRAAFSINLYSTGMQMMQGLLNGMNSMKAKVEQTARDIAKTAAKAVNAALQVKSPSRLMMETGQYTGEGLAIGMTNRISDIQAAAQAMTEPIQAQGRQMRDMSAPENPRSGVIGEMADTLSGGSTVNNTTQTSSPVFNFNPTYVIEGNADEDKIREVNRMSQADFERMMNEYQRKNMRVSFA